MCILGAAFISFGGFGIRRRLFFGSVPPFSLLKGFRCAPNEFPARPLRRAASLGSPLLRGTVFEHRYSAASYSLGGGMEAIRTRSRGLFPILSHCPACRPSASAGLRRACKACGCYLALWHRGSEGPSPPKGRSALSFVARLPHPLQRPGDVLFLLHFPFVVAHVSMFLVSRQGSPTGVRRIAH